MTAGAGVAAGHPATAQAGGGHPRPRRHRGRRRGRDDAGQLRGGDDLHRARRRRIRHRVRRGQPAGPLRRLLRQRCRVWAAKRPGPGIEIEVIFVGQRMPYEIGPATVAVPGVPAGAHHLWRHLGTAAAGRRWSSPGCEASYGTPFPRPMPGCCRGSPRRCAWATASRSTAARTARFLQAGDPLRHPDHHRAYELLISDPSRLLPRRVRRRPGHVGGRRRRTEPGPDLDAYRVIESTATFVSGGRLHRARPRRRSRRRARHPGRGRRRHARRSAYRPDVGARPWSRRCGRRTVGPRPPTSWRSTTRATAA